MLRARPVATVFRTRIDSMIVFLQGPAAVGILYISAHEQLLIKTSTRRQMLILPSLDVHS